MKRLNQDSHSKRFPLSFETKLFLYAIGAGLPGSLVAFILIWSWGFTLKATIPLLFLIVAGWIGFAITLRKRTVNSLRTLTNLLAALREGDYSMQAQRQAGNDVLSEMSWEINRLGDVMRQQRMETIEATALLRKVMDEIEVAVLAFDPERKLRLINRYVEQLMEKPIEALRGRTAEELGLQDCLSGEVPRIVDFTFPGRSGRWELRRGTYREGGQPYQLLVLSDLTQTLREEERQAWKRLVQVLRHEINNSLAPIHSLAESLHTLLLRDSRPDDWEHDIKQGLNVIGERSRSLNRFMASYAQLTKLPEPNLQPLEVRGWIQRVVTLETRQHIEITPGPDVTIQADSDQLEQMLINLVKNAVEAAQETGGKVCVSWSKVSQVTPCLEITVEDEGPGILNPDNLFVPFFTTKPEGSGLGLMIGRQIVEAHGGTLSLENRTGRTGCLARIHLPL